MKYNLIWVSYWLQILLHSDIALIALLVLLNLYVYFENILKTVDFNKILLLLNNFFK